MLKYFATNRSTENLAENTDDRPGRLRLETGGYYFVNMDAYMAYYLGEVERSNMPKSAIVQDSNNDVFSNFLNAEKIGSIVVCVHGFNVELFEAFTWFRILTDTMKRFSPNGAQIVTRPEEIPKNSRAGSLTAFVGFSWPSNGNVLSYMSDQGAAIGSATTFAGFIARLRSTGKPVKLVCHSMGNYLACNALKLLINREISPHHLRERRPELLERIDERCQNNTLDDQRLVETLIMLAPDVERRHIVKALNQNGKEIYVGPFHSGLEHLVGKAYNVYSRFDGALSISDLEKKPRDALLSAGDAMSSLSFGLLDFLKRNPHQKWEKRLGSAPHPPGAPCNIESINATEIAERKIDHSDHVDCGPLAKCIADCLAV